jgi:zeaxanthin glucosyltransferase
MLNSLPAILTELGFEAVVIDTVLIYTEPGFLSQGVPQVAIPVSLDQPSVAARIAEKKTGLYVPVKDLTVSGVSLLLDRVLKDSTYRGNARHYQKVIAEINGVSKAAGLVEHSLGAAKKTGRPELVSP